MNCCLVFSLHFIYSLQHSKTLNMSYNRHFDTVYQLFLTNIDITSFFTCSKLGSPIDFKHMIVLID